MPGLAAWCVQASADQNRNSDCLVLETDISRYEVAKVGAAAAALSLEAPRSAAKAVLRRQYDTGLPTRFAERRGNEYETRFSTDPSSGES